MLSPIGCALRWVKSKNVGYEKAWLQKVLLEIFIIWSVTEDFLVFLIEFFNKIVFVFVHFQIFAHCMDASWDYDFFFFFFF